MLLYLFSTYLVFKLYSSNVIFYVKDIYNFNETRLNPKTFKNSPYTQQRRHPSIKSTILSTFTLIANV